jgi:ribose/xylose/arabinose/galactoside ABC-type transport system permease subunit
MLAALALTLSVGVVTGFLVGRLQISAIIVTLATYISAAGLATAINGANAIPIGGALFKYLNDGVDGWTPGCPNRGWRARRGCCPRWR